MNLQTPHFCLNAQIPWQKGHSCFQDILLWSNITMYSAAWTADGRTFEMIGYYDSTGSRWNNWHNVFPNEKYHLNGRKFRVLTNIVCNYNMDCSVKVEVPETTGFFSHSLKAFVKT